VMEWTSDLPRWQNTEQRDGRKPVSVETLLGYINGKERTSLTEIPLPIKIRRTLTDPFHPAFLVWVCGPDLAEEIPIQQIPVFLGLGMDCMLNNRSNRFKVQ
ncbi:MAG: hypothetical protein ABIK28_23315, partial [Planctomycetota bacterium]